MDRLDKQILAMIGGCIVVVIGLIVLMVHLLTYFDTECAKAGGHTVTHSSNAIGFTTNGQMTITPNIDVKCYSQDGRLLLE